MKRLQHLGLLLLDDIDSAQTSQVIVFELVIFLNYGRTLKILNLFVKPSVIVA